MKKNDNDKESLYQLPNGTHIAIRKMDESNSQCDSSEIGDQILEEYMEIITIRCRACMFLTSSKQDLISHVQSNHLERISDDSSTMDSLTHLLPLTEERSSEDGTMNAEVFLCGQCSISFSNQEQCRDHMVQCHEYVSRLKEPSSETKVSSSKWKNDSKAMELKRCPRKGCFHKFKNRDLKLHLSCHGNEERKGFICPHCSDNCFVSWNSCALHLWKDHQIDMNLLSCPICKIYKTTVSSMLDNHIKIHSEQKIFNCNGCDKSFKQLSQLKNHSVIHLDKSSDSIPTWYAKKRCDICLKYFSDSKCLKKHVQAVHSKLKPYICHVCNHQSSRKAMLDMHMRQHTGDKPYKCDQCTYCTGDHNSLRRHKMRHNGFKPYKCQYCDYATIQSASFKKHMSNKHLGIQLVRESERCCYLCSYKASSEEDLTSHLNSHGHNRHKMDGTEVIIEVRGNDDKQYVIVKPGCDVMLK